MRGFRALFIVVLIIALACGVAFATITWMKTFKDLYKPKPASELSRTGCRICHVQPNGKGALNSYGKLLEKKKVDAASLKAIEKKDTDKDGFNNIIEIKAGTLPGDAKSKPAKK